MKIFYALLFGLVMMSIAKTYKLGDVAMAASLMLGTATLYAFLVWRSKRIRESVLKNIQKEYEKLN